MPRVPYASNPNRLLLPPGGSATGSDSNDAVTPFSKAYVAIHRVPGDQPHLLVPFPDVVHRHVPPVLRNVPARPHDLRAHHVPHAVHHVSAQHHQVLRPGTMVALPLAAQRLQLSNGPFRNHRLGPLLVRVSPSVCHGHPRPHPLARLQHGVRLRQRPRKRLLAEDTPDPCVGRRNHHLRPRVQPSWAHRNEVKPLPLQHLAVVAIQRPRPSASARVTQPVRIVIRNRHKVHLRQPNERRVQPVTPVATPRSPNRPRSIPCHSSLQSFLSSLPCLPARHSRTLTRHSREGGNPKSPPCKPRPIRNTHYILLSSTLRPPRPLR